MMSTIFFLPEYMIASPLFVVLFPKSDHLHSLIPSRCSLLFLISMITSACFPVSNMVRTYQKSILSLVLVLSILFIHPASSWLSLIAFMYTVCYWYSDASGKVEVFLVLVSVSVNDNGKLPSCSTSNLVDQEFVIKVTFL